MGMVNSTGISTCWGKGAEVSGEKLSGPSDSGENHRANFCKVLLRVGVVGFGGKAGRRDFEPLISEMKVSKAPSVPNGSFRL